MPVAWDNLVVGLVDVEVDGEFWFGGDDFVGGHGGGDSFLLGEIDMWHAGGACWKTFRKICVAVLVKYDRTDSANFVVKLIISQYRPKYKSLSALKLRCGVSMIRT